MNTVKFERYFNNHRDLYTKECIFQHNHNLGLYQESCLQRLNLVWFEPVLDNQLLRFMVISLMIIMGYLLISRKEKDIAVVWVGISILLGVLHKTAYLQILSQLLMYGVIHGKNGIIITICFLMMLYISPMYILVLPGIVVGSSYSNWKVTCQCFMIVTAFLTILFTLYHLFPQNTIITTVVTVLNLQRVILWDGVDLRKVAYEPGYGVFWYLHALMLKEYQTYFSCLLLSVPTVASWMIGLIVYQGYTVREDCWRIMMKLNFLVVLYFALDGDEVYHVVCLLALLCTDETLINTMRYKAILVLGLVIPLALTPVMYYLWMKLGTGNANFLFFQGLCLLVFLALFVVEYLAAYLRQLDLLKESQSPSSFPTFSLSSGVVSTPAEKKESITVNEMK